LSSFDGLENGPLNGRRCMRDDASVNIDLDYFDHDDFLMEINKDR
jgi:hypothetical protein